MYLFPVDLLAGLPTVSSNVALRAAQLGALRVAVEAEMAICGRACFPGDFQGGFADSLAWVRGVGCIC